MKLHTMAQKSSEWLQKRKGVVTGTSLKALMSTRKTTQEDAMFELIAERLTVGVDDGPYESPMDRGNRLEPMARTAFELVSGKKIEQYGFLESDRSQFIGYSPDGLVADSDESEDIEIKCPMGKNYVKMWFTNDWADEYEWQMVHGFVVNPKLKKRFFILYNPDIPAHPLHIIEVTREEVQERIDQANEKLDEFLPMVDLEMRKIIKL